MDIIQETKNAIATNLRTLRIKAGLSCEEVAKRIGTVSAVTIKRYESLNDGQAASIDVLVRLAAFYGVTLDSLVSAVDGCVTVAEVFAVNETDAYNRLFQMATGEKPEEFFEELPANINAVVAYCLETLPYEMRYILKARFFGNKTLQECGDVLHMTREGVRQKEKKALRKVNINLEKLKSLFKSQYANSDEVVSYLDEAVSYCLESLPDDQKYVLRARLFEGKKLEECGADLGLKISSVSVKQKIALATIKGKLECSKVFRDFLQN